MQAPTSVETMCGRFTQQYAYSEIVAFSQLTTSHPSDVTVATPMREAWVITLDPTGARVSVPMRWGWPSGGAAVRTGAERPKHIHARAETVDTLPTFADAFARRRGILVVRDFNEGEETGGSRKRQWVIAAKDGQPLAIAVIWQAFARGPEVLPMFVQVTTPANALIAPVTDRMPAILRPEDWPVWLGEAGATPAEAKALLQTYEDEGAWTIAPQGARKPPPAGQGGLF